MSYNANSIKILKGLTAVRKRPGMYIGSTNHNGLHQLVYEIVDNAVDEAMAGYGKSIKVTIHPDNSITVQDHGRGMPVGINKQSRKPAVDVIFTTLHAGGKFDENNYKTSGGLHGVGASVVNALSKFLNVTIVRNHHKYREKFHDGGKVLHKLTDLGPCNKHTGTTVTFSADPSIFTTVNYNYHTIRQHLQEEAYLLHGVKIVLTDERQTPTKKETFQGNIQSFVKSLNENKSSLGPVIFFKGKQRGILVEIAAQYSDGYTSNILSFVNNVSTPEGGTQITGFKQAWTNAFNEYGKKAGLIKSKRKSLKGSDTREGLSAIIALWVPERILEFEGQTKEKLGTPQAKAVVSNIVNQQLGYYLMEHGTFAQKLILKSARAKQARDAARKARNAFRSGTKKTKKRQLQISNKLTPAQSKDVSKNELFLVEGDSAGGSAKQGRDRRHQAILPLRGKVLNTEKVNMSRVIKNLELNTIIYTVGAGIGADFNIKKSNYGKIIINSDADVDGYHIQILLLTFFYNYMRPMITHGRVFVAMPPLFKLQNKSGKTHIEYAWTRADLHRKAKTFHKDYTLQRFKGLGEMSPDQLWETTMNPKRRILIKVTLNDAKQAQLAAKRIPILMGKHVAPRRKWIDNHIKFAMNDDIAILKSSK